MSDISLLTSAQLNKAAKIKDRLESLNARLAELLGFSAETAPTGKPGRKKSKFSAAGLARIRAAQKKRWATFNATNGVSKPAKKPGRKKFVMSAEAKAKISAAAKARWAKVKRAKKG